MVRVAQNFFSQRGVVLGRFCLGPENLQARVLYFSWTLQSTPHSPCTHKSRSSNYLTNILMFDMFDKTTFFLWVRSMSFRVGKRYNKTKNHKLDTWRWVSFEREITFNYFKTHQWNIMNRNSEQKHLLEMSACLWSSTRSKSWRPVELRKGSTPQSESHDDCTSGSRSRSGAPGFSLNLDVDLLGWRGLSPILTCNFWNYQATKNLTDVTSVKSWHSEDGFLVNRTD